MLVARAIYCWDVSKKAPSRRDGVIGSNRRATIRESNQLGGYGSERALRDGSQWTCSRAMNAWLLSRVLRDKNLGNRL